MMNTSLTSSNRSCRFQHAHHEFQPLAYRWRYPPVNRLRAGKYRLRSLSAGFTGFLTVRQIYTPPVRGLVSSVVCFTPGSRSCGIRSKYAFSDRNQSRRAVRRHFHIFKSSCTSYPAYDIICLLVNVSWLHKMIRKFFYRKDPDRRRGMSEVMIYLHKKASSHSLTIHCPDQGSFLSKKIQEDRIYG